MIISASQLPCPIPNPTKKEMAAANAKPPHYCHAEYASTDMEATSEFFVKLFNWPVFKRETRHYYAVPDSPLCARARPRREGEVDSTFRTAPFRAPHSSDSLDAGTITHISVPNLQETLKVALAAGATIVTPETPVETYGSYVTLRVCSCEP